MDTTTFRLPSCDGEHQSFVRQWMPRETPPRAVVQIAHGLVDHIDRYTPVARKLTALGYVVVGNDHLGHGRTVMSGAERGFFCEQDGWRTVVGDVCRLRRQMGQAYPHLPYFLLGHSMGSFLVRTYLIDHPGTVSGALLLGTGQESPRLISAGRRAAELVCRTAGPRTHSKLVERWAMRTYNRKFWPVRTRADWVSRDRARVEEYLADPLCQFMPSAGMLRDMLEGLEYIADKENRAKMDPGTPVLLLSGDCDPVGQNGAGVIKVADFFRQIGARDVTVKLYPGARHEVINEINREQVLDDLAAWLQQHTE